MGHINILTDNVEESAAAADKITQAAIRQVSP